MQQANVIRSEDQQCAHQRTIWVLEDDKAGQFLLDAALNDAYQIYFASSFDEFRSLAKGSKCSPDLVIADLRLPDAHLDEVLSTRRQEWPLGTDIPVIVVSGVEDVDVVRKCFAHGAIDFITKPFKNAELRVKVERIMALQKGHRSLVRLDDIRLTAISSSGEISKPLTSKEYQIMSLLLGGGTEGVNRQDFISRIWGESRVSDKVFDVHLFNLRKKLTPLGVFVRLRHPNLYFLDAHDD